MPNAPLAGGALGAAHRGTTDRLVSDGHEESKGNMAFLIKQVGNPGRK